MVCLFATQKPGRTASFDSCVGQLQESCNAIEIVTATQCRPCSTCLNLHGHHSPLQRLHCAASLTDGRLHSQPLIPAACGPTKPFCLWHGQSSLMMHLQRHAPHCPGVFQQTQRRGCAAAPHSRFTSLQKCSHRCATLTCVDFVCCDTPQPLCPPNVGLQHQADLQCGSCSMHASDFTSTAPCFAGHCERLQPPGTAATAAG